MGVPYMHTCVFKTYQILKKLMNGDAFINLTYKVYDINYLINY